MIYIKNINDTRTTQQKVDDLAMNGIYVTVGKIKPNPKYFKWKPFIEVINLINFSDIWNIQIGLGFTKESYDKYEKYYFSLSFIVFSLIIGIKKLGLK